MTVRELPRGRFLLDLDFRDTEGVIASYLLPGPDGYTMVETGPASTVHHLATAVDAAGVSPNEVRRVFVTHIHLDHAGAMGSVAEAFPRAQLYVHRDGLPHMLDPSRLMASARRAWGDASDTMWGTLTPVPAARLTVLDGGETFPLTGGDLRVLATPGHARHHLAFSDTATGAVMTGDAAGIQLPGMTHARPAVPPPDLDLDQLFASLATMQREHPRELWYSHFGPAPGGAEVFERYRRSVEEWRDAALAAARSEPTPEAVSRALVEYETAHSERAEERAIARQETISGYALAAQGLLRYFRRSGAIPDVASGGAPVNAGGDPSAPGPRPP